MTEKRKSFSWTTLLMTVIGGAIGFFGVQVGMKASSHLPPLVMFSMLALLIPSFFLVIALHEAGHAFVGVKVNFEFRFYVVGPFLWEKEGGQWRFKWNKNVNTFGGMVLCLPTDSKNLSKRFALYAAGGPLASLLSALLFVAVHIFLSTSTSNSTWVEILTHWAWVLFLLSSAIFLVTAVPFHSKGFSSDGARVMRLYRGGDTAMFEVLLLKFIASSSNGMRPSALNRKEMEEALQLAEKIQAPMGLYFHYYYFYHAFDAQDINLAEEHLLSYVNKSHLIPQGLHYGVYLDAAFFYAVAKRDMEKAEHYYQQFKPSALLSKAQVHATEAAIAVLKQEYNKAAESLDKAKSEIPNILDRGIGVFIEEKLVEMKREIAVSTVG